MRHPDRMGLRASGLVGLVMCLSTACATPPTPAAAPVTSAASASTRIPVPPSASATLSPTPSADPILTALGATTSRGTARVTLELLTSADGVERSLTGEGIVDFARGATDLRWSGIEGDSREVRTEEGFFVEVDQGQWLAVESGRSTPTSDAGDVLRGIADLRDPRPEGSESLDGAVATRISGWLPATGNAAGNAAGLGLTDSELASALGSTRARVQVTVWVDDSGRVIQVLRTLQEAGPVAATSVARLSEFGVAAPITAPSSIAATAQ